MSTWYSIKDKQPKKNEKVLICRKSTCGTVDYFTAIYKGKNENWFGGYKWQRDDMFYYGWDIDALRWQPITPCEELLTSHEELLTSHEELLTSHEELLSVGDN